MVEKRLPPGKAIPVRVDHPPLEDGALDGVGEESTYPTFDGEELVEIDPKEYEEYLRGLGQLAEDIAAKLRDDEEP